MNCVHCRSRHSWPLQRVVFVGRLAILPGCRISSCTRLGHLRIVNIMQIEMFDLRSVKHVCPAGQPISRAPSRHGRPPASSVRCSSSNGVSHNNTPRKAKDAKEAKQQSSLDERILSGEFTTPPSWRTRFLSGLQGLFGKSPTGPGNGLTSCGSFGYTETSSSCFFARTHTLWLLGLLVMLLHALHLPCMNQASA